MKPDIYHVKTLGNGVLSIMAKPISGEFIEEEFSAIKHFGIDTIVSLLEPFEARSLDLSNEQTLTEQNAMNFISFPIEDRGLPPSLNQYIKLVKDLYRRIKAGEHVVIHCRAGIGRTGVVACGILLLDGMAVDDAFNLLSDSRGISMPDTEAQWQWVADNAFDIVNGEVV